MFQILEILNLEFFFFWENIIFSFMNIMEKNYIFGDYGKIKILKHLKIQKKNFILKINQNSS